MNSQQVQQDLQQAQALFSDNGSYSALSTGDVIVYLQKNLADISNDLQVSFDCLNVFKCRGFKIGAKIDLQIDLASSLGLTAHENVMRSLLSDYELAKIAENNS